LNQLHAECNSRINYKKTCPIHGEVPNDQIVSGYEYAKGSYVIVDPEELEKIRTRTRRPSVSTPSSNPKPLIPCIHRAGRITWFRMGPLDRSLMPSSTMAWWILAVTRWARSPCTAGSNWSG